MLSTVCFKAFIPVRFSSSTALFSRPAAINIFRNFEWLIFPAKFLTNQSNLFMAQCGTMAVMRAGHVWRAEADYSLAAYHGRFAGFSPGSFNRGLDLFSIVAIYITDHLPAVSLETGRGIIGEPALYFTINGDAVVIPECDQFAQTQRTGQ